ncbi:MAG: DUF5343 domain-containing protein [Solidesulfovibrio sp. DCME]|uniref:DUF5343 domain-containing protein n=1 Tax=Solidesulfovibrio sp. DCME TaxID=3447380 RepID=UPI003D09A899
MSLPNAYSLKTASIPAYFECIMKADIPDVFDVSFMTSIGFRYAIDRSFIDILKELHFLSDNGMPTKRYIDFHHRNQARTALLDGIHEAYSKLFDQQPQADSLSDQEIIGVLKQLYGGKKTDMMVNGIANTFLALCRYAKEADFSPAPAEPQAASATHTAGDDGPSVAASLRSQARENAVRETSEAAPSPQSPSPLPTPEPGPQPEAAAPQAAPRAPDQGRHAPADLPPPLVLEPEADRPIADPAEPGLPAAAETLAPSQRPEPVQAQPLVLELEPLEPAAPPLAPQTATETEATPRFVPEMELPLVLELESEAAPPNVTPTAASGPAAPLFFELEPEDPPHTAREADPVGAVTPPAPAEASGPLALELEPEAALLATGAATTVPSASPLPPPATVQAGQGQPNTLDPTPAAAPRKTEPARPVTPPLSDGPLAATTTPDAQAGAAHSPTASPHTEPGETVAGPQPPLAAQAPAEPENAPSHAERPDRPSGATVPHPLLFHLEIPAPPADAAATSAAPQAAPDVASPSADSPLRHSTGNGAAKPQRCPIQIVLPESRDEAVYDAIFASLKRHLFPLGK